MITTIKPTSVRPEISRFAATLRIAISVDLEELLRGLGEAGLTLRRDRLTGDFVILPGEAMWRLATKPWRRS